MTELQELKNELRGIRKQLKFAEEKLASAATYYTNELSRLRKHEVKIDTARLKAVGLNRAGQKI